MYEFTFGKLTATVASITKRNDNYYYAGYSTTTTDGNVRTIRAGHITPDYLAGLTGTDDEKLEQFFEALTISYDERDKGDISKANTQLTKVGLGEIKTPASDVALKASSKTKLITQDA